MFCLKCNNAGCAECGGRSHHDAEIASLRSQLAEVRGEHHMTLAERDAAVSVGTQLERELAAARALLEEARREMDAAWDTERQRNAWATATTNAKLEYSKWRERAKNAEVQAISLQSALVECEEKLRRAEDRADLARLNEQARACSLGAALQSWEAAEQRATEAEAKRGRAEVLLRRLVEECRPKRLKGFDGSHWCECDCGGMWRDGEPEDHSPDCLYKETRDYLEGK